MVLKPGLTGSSRVLRRGVRVSDRTETGIDLRPRIGQTYGLEELPAQKNGPAMTPGRAAKVLQPR